MFQKSDFSRLSNYSGGEVERMIHDDLSFLPVVKYWPAAQGAPWPLLEEARKLIKPDSGNPCRSYGYINGRHPEARVWFIREEDQYSVYVSFDLYEGMIDAIRLLCLPAEILVTKVDGWTKLNIRHSSTLPLVMAALTNWARGLVWEGGERRQVEFHF